MPIARAAGLLVFDYDVALRAQALDQQPHLGRFAASFGSFETDEQAARPQGAGRASVIDEMQQGLQIFPGFAFGLLVVLAQQIRGMIGDHHRNVAATCAICRATS